MSKNRSSSTLTQGAKSAEVVMFWIGFVALTMVCLGIASLIILGIQKYYHNNDRNFLDYVWNEEYDSNNNWFYFLVGVCIVTFVIACFNFGPAVLLPKHYPTPEQRATGMDILRHLWYGNQAPAKVVPTDPLPWATGTWFWWKSFFLYLLTTILYFPFAFWDEGVAAYHFVVEEIKKHHDNALAKKRSEHTTKVKKIQEANSKKKKGEPETPPPPPPPDKLRFEEFMEWGVVIEILFSLIKFLKEMKEA